MLKTIRLLFAFCVCLTALLLPYSLRLVWFKMISDFVHFPFRLFGKIGQVLIRATQGQNPYSENSPPPPSRTNMKSSASQNEGKQIAILFSGGTDSTCTAALSAEKYQTLHLLTFHETLTRNSPVPIENARRLQNHFPQCHFHLLSLNTDRLIKYLSYENYFHSLFKYGFYLLATPGLSSLSWHLRTISYCLENGIADVHDGMTNELTHLPGHMPEIRRLFSHLYLSFGINFSSPVINWEVPPDQQSLDRLIIDRHGFVADPTLIRPQKTTGQYLYDKGLFPHPNVKGSLFDRSMQHDCYPFVVYNIFVFWWAQALGGPDNFKKNLNRFFSEKCQVGKNIVAGRHSKFKELFEKVEQII